MSGVFKCQLSTASRASFLSVKSFRQQQQQPHCLNLCRKLHRSLFDLTSSAQSLTLSRNLYNDVKVKDKSIYLCKYLAIASQIITIEIYLVVVS